MKIYIQQDGQKSGPFSRDELREKTYSGLVPRTTSACIEGGTDWVPLETLLVDPPKAAVSHPLTPPVTIAELRDPREQTALMWLYIASVPAWLFLLGWSIAGLGLP